MSLRTARGSQRADQYRAVRLIQKSLDVVKLIVSIFLYYRRLEVYFFQAPDKQVHILNGSGRARYMLQIAGLTAQMQNHCVPCKQ